MSPSELWCSVIVPWRLIFAISFWEVSMELTLGSAVVANTQLLHNTSLAGASIGSPLSWASVQRGK